MDPMWTIHSIWRALFIIWLSPASLGYAQVVEQPGIVLITPEEAEKLRLSEEEWKIIDEILTRRQALSTLGPLIAVRSPTVQPTNPIPTIETATPINLLVHFIENGAPVKLETLEVCGKTWGFRRCFTDKLKPYLNVHTNSLEAPNLDVPTGKYVLEIRIANDKGQETVANYKVVVAKGFCCKK
jgi:hypothetical protein